MPDNYNASGRRFGENHEQVTLTYAQRVENVFRAWQTNSIGLDEAWAALRDVVRETHRLRDRLGIDERHYQWLINNSFEPWQPRPSMPEMGRPISQEETQRMQEAMTNGWATERIRGISTNIPPLLDEMADVPPEVYERFQELQDNSPGILPAPFTWVATPTTTGGGIFSDTNPPLADQSVLGNPLSIGRPDRGRFRVHIGGIFEPTDAAITITDNGQLTFAVYGDGSLKIGDNPLITPEMFGRLLALIGVQPEQQPAPAPEPAPEPTPGGTSRRRVIEI